MQQLLKLGLSLALFALATLASGRAAESRPEFYPLLKAGSITYTNVKVLNKAKHDLFVQHAGGMASIKVKELDKSTQLQLGYMLADPPPTNAPARVVPALQDIEIDPRYEELYEQIIWESQEALSQFKPEVVYGGWEPCFSSISSSAIAAGSFVAKSARSRWRWFGSHCSSRFRCCAPRA